MSSPDLNLCDYYLWKAIQDRLQPRYGTRVELRADILRQALSLPLEEIRRSICSWPQRLLKCHMAGGGHFEGWTGRSAWPRAQRHAPTELINGILFSQDVSKGGRNKLICLRSSVGPSWSPSAIMCAFSPLAPRVHPSLQMSVWLEGTVIFAFLWFFFFQVRR